MDSFAENMWVWDVTSPEMVTEENWNEVNRVYVEDKYQLKLLEYFDKNNPYALQSMVSTMLEAREKGYWHPSSEVFENLVKVYAESVVAHGISGDYGSTDQAMHKDVSEVLKTIKDLPAELIEDYQRQVEPYRSRLEPVKGYEVKEVKSSETEDEKEFKPRLGFFILLAILSLILTGCWRESRKR